MGHPCVLKFLMGLVEEDMANDEYGRNIGELCGREEWLANMVCCVFFELRCSRL